MANLSLRSKLFLVSVIPSPGLNYLLYNLVFSALGKKGTTPQVQQDKPIGLTNFTSKIAKWL